MRELIESISNGELLSALELFEERMDFIKEQKLYEVKRSLRLDEIVKATGKLNADGNPEYAGQNSKKDWAKYRKANKTPKWDQDKEGNKVAEKPKGAPFGHGGKLSADDIKKRRKAGYLQAAPALNSIAFIKAVHKHLENKKKLDETSITDTLASLDAKTKRLGSTAGNATATFGNQTVGNASATPRDAGVNPDLKRLKPKVPNHAKMSTDDRYANDIERAKKLEARGRTGSVNRVNRAYRGYRMKKAAKNAYSSWGNWLSKSNNGNLEE